jgi:hypothetical protein
VVALRPYGRSMDPPGPVAEVIVSNPTNGKRTGILPGKIDTGSDVTLVPIYAIVHLSAESHGWCCLHSHDKSSMRRSLYFLNVSVEGYDVLYVPCIAMDRANVLLGRDGLNHFTITLDGKNQIFSLTH